MASPLAKAAADTVAVGSFLSSFLAATSKEQQLAILCEKLYEAQQTYIAANPTFTAFIGVVATSAKVLGLSAIFKISDDAASIGLVAGTTASDVGATKLTIPGGDVVTDAALVALTGLASLERQIMSLAVDLSGQENAYNTAHPTTPFNNISLIVSFDSNKAQVLSSLPLNPAALVNAVTAYLP